MKESICTIPINDVFLPKDGCPMCRLEKMLENNYVEYITGAAMMEPNVRVATNETGFCGHHFSQMIQSGKRLPNALILQTHLQQVQETLLPKNVKGKPDKKNIAALEALQSKCFVCDKIQWGINHMMETIFNSWETDNNFKKLFAEQPYICVPHYTMLIKAAAGKHGVSNKNLSDFYQAAALLAGGYLESLKKDIDHFCTMFDYRSKGQEYGTSIDSVERSVQFLTGTTIKCSDNDVEN